jgi:hypothetical protein
MSRSGMCSSVKVFEATSTLAAGIPGAARVAGTPVPDAQAALELVMSVSPPSRARW